MINPKWQQRINAATVSVDGVRVGSIQNLSYDLEKSEATVPLRVEGSFTLHGGITKAGEEWLRRQLQDKMDTEDMEHESMD